MVLERILRGEKVIAAVTGEETIITDAQSALDLIMSVQYETKTNLLAIDKRVIAEDFFVLSSGLAGEVLQKFINYHTKVAIYGDYSRYTSKPLRDFISESNRGKDIFFVSSKEEAIQKLISSL
ncbi:MAG: DUF4180 domain-containing protein [Oscillospiraceae bacterium]|jgi:hypothetical protein